MTDTTIVRADVQVHTHLAGNLWQIILEAPSLTNNARHGQFFQLYLGEDTGHLLPRPLSIHAVYSSERDTVEGLSLIYQVVGKGTSYLTSLSEGEKIDVLGPLGKGWSVPEHAKSILLVGGGVGWAPLAMLARDMVEEGRIVHALIGARTADYLNALVEALELCPMPEGLEEADPCDRLFYHLATDDGSMGHHGMNTELLDALLNQHEIDYMAACGPEPMLRIVAAQALKHEISCEVSLERRMACGIGACVTCTVETTSGSKRACVDGPVFDAREVVW